MRSLLLTTKRWRKAASVSLRIFATTLFAATNITGLMVVRASAQTPGQAKIQSATNQIEVVDGEILVKLKPSARPNLPTNLSPEFTGQDSLDKVNKSVNAQKFDAVFKRGKNVEASELDGWYKISLPNSGKQISSKNDEAAFNKLQAAINKYKGNESVEAVEPNYIAHSMAIPNDPFYGGYQWNMPKINAPGAWDVSVGSGSMIVAVIDTGVQFAHEDLQNAMWDNPSCSHSPEDYREGYDFIANSCFQNDDNGHGTHVAGIIGAVGNNGIGVAGMNWNVKIMGLKTGDSAGNSLFDNVARALRFAADNGAKVANMSLGSPCNCVSQVTEDAVNYAHDRDVTVVAAAGNGLTDANGNFLSRTDALDVTPANIDNVITVGATDSNDAVANFSSYGPKLDVVAPGVGIISTTGPGNFCHVSGVNNYCIGSGTSFAAPHVAGMAALLKTINPGLTPEQIRQQLRRPESVADLGAAGRDSDYGYGRINANEAAHRTGSRTLAPFFSNIKSRQQLTLPSGSSSYNINGGVPGPNFTQYWIDIGQGRNPSSWTRIVTSSAQVNNGVLGSIPQSFFNGGTYTIRITGSSQLLVSPPDVSSKYFESSVFDVKLAQYVPFVDTTAPSAPGSLSAVASSSSQINLSWSASTDNVGVTGYQVFRTNAGTTPIATVTGTSYSDTGLSPATSYSYYVKAYDAAGNVSAPTNTVTISTNYSSGGSDTTPPSAPTNVAATALSSSQIRISWSPSTDNVGVTSYTIVRNGTTIVATVGSNVTSYTDNGLAASTTYSYSVIASDGAGNGTQSNSVSATTSAASADTTPPTAPSLTVYSISSSQLYLSWRGATDNVGVTGYRIYRSDRGLAPIATVSAGTSTYLDSGLLPRTSYTYYVTAIDAAGNSSQFSNAGTAATR